MKCQAISLSLIYISLVTACSQPSKEKPIAPVDVPTPWEKNASLDRGLERYSDCEELQAEVRAELQQKKEQDQARPKKIGWVREDKSTRPSNNSQNVQPIFPSNTKESFTYTQVEGIDEPDTTKIGKHHIFVISAGRIITVDRQSLELTGEIAVKNLKNVKLFTRDDLLIIVGMTATKSPSLALSSSPVWRDNTTNTTEVRFYQLSKGADPSLTKKHQLQGSYVDSRFMGERLILVLKEQLEFANSIDHPASTDLSDIDIPDQPIVYDYDEVSFPPCEALVKSPVQDLDYRVTYLANFDIGSLDENPQLLGVRGGGDQIYMSRNALFLVKQVGYAYWLEDNPEQAYITKISYYNKSEHFEVKAVGAVPGRIKDQWAFKHYTDIDLLALFTTTGQLFSKGDDAAKNHLWILEETDNRLNVTASITDWGKTEDIRSVRYLQDMAYVVTFKKTDPLFAFNLSDPLSPRLEGELKIPGFSTFMHPVADKQLIGVGYDAIDQGDFALFQGIQVSLFDVSHSAEMTRTDNKIHGERGSYSDATSDHHAFYYDSERLIFGIPIVEISAQQNQVQYSGAVLYQVKGAELQELARISHKDWIPKDCLDSRAGWHWWRDKTRSLDVNRLYKVDNRLLSVSQFGIKEHSLDDPSQLNHELKFKDTEATICSFGPVTF